MHLGSQKHRFSLPEDVHFLNSATFSPMSKAAEFAGLEAIKKMANPFHLKANDFFDYAQSVRADFSKLINAEDVDRIALIPSASYGLSTVARNLHRKEKLKAGQQILILDHEFPNDILCFKRAAEELSLEIKIIKKPEGVQIGRTWNEQILDALTQNVALIVIPHVHWIYGTIFDLKKISDKCQELNILLIIDGTQSLGAMPFDVQEIKADAIVAGSYKSLLGSYQVGFAYFGSFFDEGVPIEESWMNRLESDQFSKLIDYQFQYRPKAQRYNVGEFSNFNSLPISGTALKEILDWKPASIQAYCKDLIDPFLEEFIEIGCQFEEDDFRASHLFGIQLRNGVNPLKVQEVLLKHQVYVAVRGNSIRISPQIYNEKENITALLNALKESLS